MNILLVCYVPVMLGLSIPGTASQGTYWGFWAHKFINRAAVYRLPPEMAAFFKQNIDLISENAVNPDRRRYSVPGEAERHFIDLDAYGDSADSLPRSWNDAVARFGEDSLRKHGIAPWYLQQHIFRLREAFRNRNTALILRLAADLGHYIADIHVPLHTTRNYNGQLTGQEGIHAFWESRLPELFAPEYDFWIGPVSYLDDIPGTVWTTVYRAHAACDSVLGFEKKAALTVSPEKQYTYENRNNILVKQPSREFSGTYHKMLAGQVERQMRAAIRLIGDLWYTCWVDAGQPVLETTQMEYPDDSLTVSPVPLPGIRLESEH